MQDAGGISTKVQDRSFTGELWNATYKLDAREDRFFQKFQEKCQVHFELRLEFTYYLQ